MSVRNSISNKTIESIPKASYPRFPISQTSNSKPIRQSSCAHISLQPSPLSPASSPQPQIIRVPAKPSARWNVKVKVSSPAITAAGSIVHAVLARLVTNSLKRVVFTADIRREVRKVHWVDFGMKMYLYGNIGGLSIEV